MYNKLKDYIKGTRVELKNVNWPSQKQIINFTLLVIGISIAVALFLSFFDMIFSYLLKTFVQNKKKKLEETGTLFTPIRDMRTPLCVI